MGLANIDGRPVAVGGEDFTIRGGTSWSRRPQEGRPGRLRRGPRARVPHSAGQPDRRRRRQRHLDQQARPLGVSRRARLRALGRAAGQGAGGLRGDGHRRRRPGRTRDPLALVGDGEGTSQIFAAGPPVVERSLGQKLTKEELGGPQIAVDHRRHDRQSRRRRSELLRDDAALPLLHAAERLGAAARSSTCGDPVDRCDEELLRPSCRATGAGPTTCAS